MWFVVWELVRAGNSVPVTCSVRKQFEVHSVGDIVGTVCIYVHLGGANDLNRLWELSLRHAEGGLSVQQAWLSHQPSPF